MRMSQVTSHKSQVTSHKSQVTSHKSQVTSHKPQVTSRRSQNHKSQVTSDKSRICHQIALVACCRLHGGTCMHAPCHTCIGHGHKFRHHSCMQVYACSCACMCMCAFLYVCMCTYMSTHTNKYACIISTHVVQTSSLRYRHLV
jgi:hypothetical protein